MLKKIDAPAGIARTLSAARAESAPGKSALRILSASAYIFGRVFARLLGQKGAFEPGSQAWKA